MLPVAAVPVLRAAARVYADATVPDEVWPSGADRLPAADDPEVLITTDRPVRLRDAEHVIAAADRPARRCSTRWR